MKLIDIAARLWTAEGNVAVGAPVQIEAFELARGGWVELAKGQTDANGELALRAQLPPGQTHRYAPQLRLVEPGQPAPRVLAEGGMVSYNAQQLILRVDFGELEQLEETAYTRAAAKGAAVTGIHVVAGEPRRSEVTSAMMVRALAMTNNKVMGAVAQPQAVLERGEIARKILAVDIDRAAAERKTADTATNATKIGTAATGVHMPTGISVDRFNAEMMTFLARETTLRADLLVKERELSNAGAKLAGLEQTLADQQQRLAVAEKLRAQADSEAATLRAATTREASLQSLAANIGSEAEAANKVMAAGGTAYRVGKLQVTLRGVIGQNGASISLSNPADLARPGAGSVVQDVSIDLIPERAPAQSMQGIKTPDVLGLTESAARRALAAVGLRMETATRPSGAGGRFAVGQAMQQSPVAGTVAQPGEAVIVVFASP